MEITSQCFRICMTAYTHESVARTEGVFSRIINEQKSDVQVSY